MIDNVVQLIAIYFKQWKPFDEWDGLTELFDVSVFARNRILNYWACPPANSFEKRR